MKSKLDTQIIKEFGNKLRVRASGILVEKAEILLIKHHNIGEEKEFWSPPGGGVQFGETIDSALKREFLEETSLQIEVEEFLFCYEYLDSPLHAIELFFKVKKISGNLILGSDPELDKESQIIQKLEFVSLQTIQKNPKIYHPCFLEINTIDQLQNRHHFIKS